MCVCVRVCSSLSLDYKSYLLLQRAWGTHGRGGAQEWVNVGVVEVDRRQVAGSSRGRGRPHKKSGGNKLRLWRAERKGCLFVSVVALYLGDVNVNIYHTRLRLFLSYGKRWSALECILTEVEISIILCLKKIWGNETFYATKDQIP